MNALIDQLTTLRLHGMAACAHDLLSARKPPSLTTAVKQLIDAETVERRVRSIQYQMRIAKFPHHKDFATFDYSAAAVTQPQIEPFCTGQFTEEAHNLILVGGTGTGKTHIAIALGTTLINNGKKARFFNAVDLINALIKEQAEGNAGKIIRQLSALDCVIIDELGYIPFPKSGSALLPSNQQALRADQCHHHHQPGVRRVGLGLRRCQNDNRASGSRNPSLCHHRNGQYVVQVRSE